MAQRSDADRQRHTARVLLMSHVKKILALLDDLEVGESGFDEVRVAIAALEHAVELSFP